MTPTPAPAEQARRLWLVPALAAAGAALLAPSAVQAADQLEAVLRDPYNSSAVARLSEDGRLGVRGETTTQAGIPSNAWHASARWSEFRDSGSEPVLGGPRNSQPVWAAPPGSGIGISQITVFNGFTEADSQREPDVPSRRGGVFLYYAHSADGKCGSVPPEKRQLLTTVPVPSLAKDDGPRQVVFPVPLTVPPSAAETTCLYAGASAGLRAGMEASGVTGRPTRDFAPAKGQPAPQPSNTLAQDPEETVKPEPQP